jgi:hypothetical protein
VGENLLDHRWLLDQGDEPHFSTTPGTHQRIDVVDLLDDASTGALRRGVGDRAEISMIEGSSSFLGAFSRFIRCTLL